MPYKSKHEKSSKNCFSFTKKKIYIAVLLRDDCQQIENKRGIQVSISPTFYEQLFSKKVKWATFLCLSLGSIFNWEIGVNAAHKMLVKWTKGVIFTNILRTANCTNVKQAAFFTWSLALYFFVK